MTPGLFITGTDTEVGKTFITALLAKRLIAEGMQVGVYKPVASACYQQGADLVSEDAVTLWEAAGRPDSLEAVCPQRFAAPLAPPLAAHLEGRQIDSKLLRHGLEHWKKQADVVLVEGAGGLMSPIGPQEYVADLAYEFGFPLVIVAPNTLGVINQTLQTLITASTFRGGLPVAGIVLNDVRQQTNDVSVSSNRQELEERCSSPILAHVQWNATEILTQLQPLFT